MRLRSFWSGLACGEPPTIHNKKGDPKAAFHLLRGSIDLVSETAHGSQILGVRRIFLDLGAHALDMHVERLGVAHIIRTPDAVDQLVTRHHTALVLHEVFEQFEFLEREEHGFAAYGDLMLANLHDDIATHQRNIVIHSAGSLGSG